MYFKMREYRYRCNILYVKCNRCWKFKILEDFPKNKRYKRWINCHCKQCRGDIVNLSIRKNHERVNEYNKEQIKKRSKLYWFNRHTFHMKAYRYVLKNWIIPLKCPICKKSTNIQIHHPSYNSFDDRSKVVLCCTKCHNDIHNNKIQCPEPIDLLLINKNE